MCGISGIINKKPVSKNKIKSEIKKMNDLIIHRGPDDEGYYFGENFAFGHRRLAILDLSEAGHQPMEYKGKNGEYVITYNGEIYNYIEIKTELIKEGYEFKSNTDTEVILASYDKWGENCVNKFNGMWAFAIYDKNKNIIFCSRDRFGIKPFYYTEIDNKFVFGSEIKQLLEHYSVRYLNKNILLDYLVFGLLEHTNETFFEKIYKLEQSHNLIYDLNSHTFEIKKYYVLNIDNEIMEEQKIISLCSQKLNKSINIRLRSDVKVGTCLSGGLDSSSIAAIASKLYGGKIKISAIHAKSIEKKTDESKYAKIVADYCNLELNIVEPSLKDIKDVLEEVIYTQEEPFGGPSIIMQYFVFKKAKELDCKVMLDGQGGDEVFFGYESYYIVYFYLLLKKLKLISFFKQFINLQSYKISKKKILFGSLIFLLRSKLYSLEKLYRKNKLKLKVDIETLYREIKDLKSFQKDEVLKFNLPALLRYEDKNSMKYSIESRVPFVDFNVVQSGIIAKDEVKFKNGYLKYILRQIVKSILPTSVVFRRNKFGFEAPTDLFFIEYKKEMIKHIKNSLIIKEFVDLEKINFEKLNNNLLWRFFNIARWEKVFQVVVKNKGSKKYEKYNINSFK